MISQIGENFEVTKAKLRPSKRWISWFSQKQTSMYHFSFEPPNKLPHDQQCYNWNFDLSSLS